MLGLKSHSFSTNILLADDDADVHELVRLLLEKKGIRVVSAMDGEQALTRWRQRSYALIILDRMMPKLDGLEVCRRMRAKSLVPILFVTAQGEEGDVVEGLEAGADDYIVKPFRAQEFVARVKAIIRRERKRTGQLKKQLEYQNLILDVSARRVHYNDRTVSITPLEFELLRYLMEHLGEVISKEDLLQNVWGYRDTAGDLNLIEASVRRLRKKLEINPSAPEYIQTVWGTGYRFG